MTAQHLHNKIGNQIGECKKRLMDRLKSGADVDDSIAVFIAELRLGLATAVRDMKPKTDESGSIT